MRRKALVSLAALLAVVLAVPAFAQEGAKYAKCTVPFEFTAGNQVMPAGEYYIVQRDSGTIEIGSLDTHHVVHLMTSDVTLSGVPGDSKVLFNRYGDQYFLTRIVRQGDRTASDVQQTSTERALARAGASPPVALPAK